jgi:hypothetical protein
MIHRSKAAKQADFGPFARHRLCALPGFFLTL